MARSLAVGALSAAFLSLASAVAAAQGGTVTGTVTFDCDGPDPGEVELVLNSDHGEVGSQTADFVCVNAHANGEQVASGSPVDVSIPVANAAAGVDLGSLTLEIHLLRQGAVQWTELDAPPSFLTIPRVGAPTGSVVQVAIDDATFGAASRLAVTGADTWSASWSLGSVGEGAHTIYARAGTTAGFGPAASVGVTIASGASHRNGSVEVQVVPAGATPSLAGWRAAGSYDQPSGAWSYAWDTGAVTNGPYDFHARLLGDGVEEARDMKTIEVGNTRPPVLDPVGDKTVNEGQTLAFTVSGSDPDGDALTFSATNLPAGATFNAATRTFSWVPGFDQAGSYPGVQFAVTDSTGRSDTEDITITVVDVNRPPTLAAIPDQTVTQGQLLAFPLDGADPDDDTLAYRAVDAPPGLAVDSATGAVTWTPGLGQAGSYDVTFEVRDPSGSTAQQVAHIEVLNNAPTAAGSCNPTRTDRVTPVTCTDASHDGEGAVVSWLWSFGDGVTSTLRNPSHTYATLGSYTVSLQVTDDDGATHTADVAHIVVANAPPKAQASSDTTSTDRITSVQFTDASTDIDGSVVAWLWDFGDGVISTAQNPAHTYGGLRAFTPTLTVTDNDGDSDAATLAVITVVNLLPTASASSDTTGTDRLTAVQFTDASTDADGSVASFAWNFGDGTTSSVQNPAHTYAALGTFTPTLTVTDNDGGTDTATLAAITIANLPPTASGASATTTTDRLTAVQFTDASTDADGTIASYAWNFGDGSTSTQRNPTHTYATLGTFTPTLEVTDDDGATDSATLAAITVRNLLPTASGSSDRTDTDRLTAVQFTDASTDPDGTIASYAWNFGDGSTSSQRNPTHTYAALGTFAPTLRVTDNDGGSASATLASITVSNLLPTASASSNRTTTDRLTAVQFTDASTDADGTIASYAWNFGDGSTSAQRNPTHTYAALGTFAPTLQVTDNNGGTASTSLPAITVVNVGPSAAFVADPATGTRTAPIRFTDQSGDRDGHIAAWAWTFGDGATSTAQSPGHQYAMLGTFTVTLVVTDDDGATATATSQVSIVNVAPTAEIHFNPELPMILDPVRFDDANSTDPDGPIASWSWDFGDGATSTLQDPVHTYVEGGIYTVTLVITDTDGAQATAQAHVAVCDPVASTIDDLDLNHIHLEGTACIRLDDIL